VIILKIINSLKNNEKTKQIIFIGSLFITFIFASFNFFMGIKHQILWNISISMYYLLLFLLKLLTHFNYSSKIIKRINDIFFLLLNFSLIIPISLLALNEKKVEIGLILSLAIATYTTIKVVITIRNIIHYKKAKIFNEMATINLIDTIVSILNLQNTLILTNGGKSEEMFIISVISSFIFFLIIIIITIKFIFSYQANL